jgi:hypothetical protein
MSNSTCRIYSTAYSTFRHSAKSFLSGRSNAGGRWQIAGQRSLKRETGARGGPLKCVRELSPYGRDCSALHRATNLLPDQNQPHHVPSVVVRRLFGLQSDTDVLPFTSYEGALAFECGHQPALEVRFGGDCPAIVRCMFRLAGAVLLEGRNSRPVVFNASAPTRRATHLFSPSRLMPVASGSAG